MKKRKLVNRIITGILTIALIVGNCYYYAPMKAEAAATYDVNAALAYAAAHWNTETNQWCAEYVSRCIRAGGLNMSVETFTGKCLRAAEAASGISKVQLRLDSSGYATKGLDGDILDAGDLVIQYCTDCNKYPHVVICGGYNSQGYATYYAHNGARNNTRMALNKNSQHEATCNIVGYVVHLSALSNPVTQYTLDVNPVISGNQYACGKTGFTFSVAIKDANGNDVSSQYGASNVTDYCRAVPQGYRYTVTPNTKSNYTNSGKIEGVVSGDTVVKPTWMGAQYQLILDAGGGYFSNEKGTTVKRLDPKLITGEFNWNDISSYPVVRDGYALAGWYMGGIKFYTADGKANYMGLWWDEENGFDPEARIGGGGGSLTVYAEWIPVDKTPPVISNVQVSDYTVTGYTVTCTVTDNVAVDRVQFPTWTDANGGDDLVPDWGTSEKVKGVKSGNTYTFTVKSSDHNNEQGLYKTHIYAYDTVGNYICYKDEIQVTVATYNLYLDPNGGKFSNGSGAQRTASPKLIYKGENSWDVSANKPVREGYTFEGWYTAATGGTKIYGADSIACADGTYWTLDIKNKKYQYVYTGDLKVYAHWKADVENYNLYLNPNGGAFNDGTTSQRTASPKLIYKGENWWDVSANKPVREGYTFEGWYTAATGGAMIYGADGIACADGTYWTLDIKNKKYQYVYTGDLKVYAHWKADIVTISYDANGGTGAPQPQQKKPSERMQLSSDAPSRAGYFFDGWNTEADGSGRSYGAGAEYAGNTDVTLYAQWVENASYAKSMNKVKVSKIAKQNYTGSAITPKLTVKLGKQKLQENVDYTVSYVNNVKTGKATAVLTGIGEFIGTREVGFNIVGSSITKAKVTGITAKIYDGQEHKQNLTVKLKGNVLKENEDYEVSYSKNLKAGTATVKITGLNAFSGTIKKTFKIAAYNLAKDEAGQIGGIPKNLTMAYTGGGCTPEFNLTFRGTELVKNKDYTVVYKNNKAVGSVADKKHPTVVIKGKGNFKGTINVAFNILPVSVTDARMSAEITEEEITVNDPEQMQDQLQDQSQDEAVAPAEQEEYGTTDGGTEGSASMGAEQSEDADSSEQLMEQDIGHEYSATTSDGEDIGMQ